MIGGVQDVYSKTLVGVRSDGDGAPQLLILDPHYVGGAAHSGDVEALRAGGWAAWKPLGAAMSAASVYNIALPTRGAGGQQERDHEPRAASAAPAPPPPAAAAAGSWNFEVVDEGFEAP